MGLTISVGRNIIEIPIWPRKNAKNAACRWEKKRIAVPARLRFVVTAANVRPIVLAAAKRNKNDIFE